MGGGSLVHDLGTVYVRSGCCTVKWLAVRTLVACFYIPKYIVACAVESTVINVHFLGANNGINVTLVLLCCLLMNWYMQTFDMYIRRRR